VEERRTPTGFAFSCVPEVGPSAISPAAAPPVPKSDVSPELSVSQDPFEDICTSAAGDQSWVSSPIPEVLLPEAADDMLEEEHASSAEGPGERTRPKLSPEADPDCAMGAALKAEVEPGSAAIPRSEHDKILARLDSIKQYAKSLCLAASNSLMPHEILGIRMGSTETPKPHGAAAALHPLGSIPEVAMREAT